MTMRNNFCFGFRPLNPTDNESTAWFFMWDTFIFFAFSELFTCIFGLVGHGILLWLLTFSIKRNAFATYLLNLSVASFGLLSFLFIKFLCEILFLMDVHNHITIYVIEISFQVFLLTYTSRQFILTAVSIDKCLSVLFPNWHRNHKSPHIPSFVCLFLWGLSFLIFGVQWALLIIDKFPYDCHFFSWCWLHGTFLIVFLVVTGTTLTLFVKVCFKSQPQQHRTMKTAILLTLLLSLLADTLWLFIYFLGKNDLYFILVRSLESSINPLIYFLVGRWKGHQLWDRMSVILQRVFKEEEPPLPNQTQLQHLQRTSRF